MSWRNHFTCDVLAEKGSAHIESLCKWGPTTFTHAHARAAERPAARGDGDAGAGRPDLGARIRAFQAVCAPRRRATDLDNDLWLHAHAAAAVGAKPSRRRAGMMSQPTIGFRRHDASRPLLGDRGGEQGLRRRRLRCRRGARRRRSATGELPVVEPGLDDLLAANRDAHDVHARCRARSRDCDVVYVAPDVPTDDAGRSDLAPLDAPARARVCAALRADAVLVVLSQVPPGFTRARQRAGRAALLPGRDADLRPRGGARARSPSASSSAAPIPRSRCRRRSRRSSRRSAARSCRCATRARSSPRSPSTAASSPRSASPTRWPSCARASAPTGREIAPALQARPRASARTPISRRASASPAATWSATSPPSCALGDEHGTDAGVVRAWQSPTAAHRRDWAAAHRARGVLPASRDATDRACWGLAYKENTHSAKNSPALSLLAALGPCAVRAYDPVVAPRAEWHPEPDGRRRSARRLRGRRRGADRDALAAVQGARAVRAGAAHARARRDRSVRLPRPRGVRLGRAHPPDARRRRLSLLACGCAMLDSPL